MHKEITQGISQVNTEKAHVIFSVEYVPAFKIEHLNIHSYNNIKTLKYSQEYHI